MSYRLCEGISLRRGPGGAFWAFSTSTGEHFELNESGFLVLEALRDGTSADGLHRVLCDEYGVTESEAERDTSDLIQSCMRAGVVTREA